MLHVSFAISLLERRNISSGALPRAFRGSDPHALEHFTRHHAELMYLSSALLRHAEQFPALSNGLG